MERNNDLDFLHIYTNQEKIACKTVTASLLSSSVASHSQTLLNLVSGVTGWFGDDITNNSNNKTSNSE